MRSRLSSYFARHPNASVALMMLLVVAIPLMDLGRIGDAGDVMSRPEWASALALATVLGVLFAIPMFLLIVAQFLPAWQERGRSLKWTGGVWTAAFFIPFLWTHPRHEELALSSPTLLGAAVFSDAASSSMLAGVVVLTIVRRSHPAFRVDKSDIGDRPRD